MSYREELIKKIETQLPQGISKDPKFLAEVIDRFAKIEEPPITLRMIVLHKDWEEGAESRKPGNILLNWRSLFDSTQNLAFAGAGAATDRWLIPFAALLAWKEVRKLTHIRIEARHAVALEVMWANRNSDNRVQKARALELLNKKLAEYKKDQAQDPEFEQILDALKALRCIEIESETIWLREWMRRET
jgi:hypothetical protein